MILPELVKKVKPTGAHDEERTQSEALSCGWGGWHLDRGAGSRAQVGKETRHRVQARWEVELGSSGKREGSVAG